MFVDQKFLLGLEETKPLTNSDATYIDQYYGFNSLEIEE